MSTQQNADITHNNHNNTMRKWERGNKHKALLISSAFQELSASINFNILSTAIKLYHNFFFLMFLQLNEEHATYWPFSPSQDTNELFWAGGDCMAEVTGWTPENPFIHLFKVFTTKSWLRSNQLFSKTTSGQTGTQVLCSGSKQETEIRKSQKLTLYPLKQCYYFGFVYCYIKPMST